MPTCLPAPRGAGPPRARRSLHSPCRSRAPSRRRRSLHWLGSGRVASAAGQGRTASTETRERLGAHAPWLQHAPASRQRFQPVLMRASSSCIRQGMCAGRTDTLQTNSKGPNEQHTPPPKPPSHPWAWPPRRACPRRGPRGPPLRRAPPCPAQAGCAPHPGLPCCLQGGGRGRGARALVDTTGWKYVQNTNQCW